MFINSSFIPLSYSDRVSGMLRNFDVTLSDETKRSQNSILRLYPWRRRTSVPTQALSCIMCELQPSLAQGHQNHVNLAISTTGHMKVGCQAKKCPLDKNATHSLKLLMLLTLLLTGLNSTRCRMLCYVNVLLRAAESMLTDDLPLSENSSHEFFLRRVLSSIHKVNDVLVVDTCAHYLL